MTSLPMPPNYAEHVLVASPSNVVRQRVLESLRSPVRRCEQAEGGAEALVHLEKGCWQVLFLDRRLPDLDAEELSATVRRRFPEIEVVLLDSESDAKPDTNLEISTFTQTESTLSFDSAIRASAIDGELTAHCVGPEVVADLEDRHSATDTAMQDAPRGPQSLSESVLPGMIGNSRVMQPVYRLARLLAHRNTTVLITGPTGSGKEILARAIHKLSPRASATFAVVNCAAIPETLLEAELFGYARGAFTGAMKAYAGRIQSAEGGTLFLDEIGEMPLSLQPKLLRFLEQKELQRLGSAEVVRVDARIVSATNAHLLSLVREGKFRDDLYYRLSAFPIEIPPLRDRGGDIVQLAGHFLEKFASPLPPPQFSVAALQLMKSHPWAGNIRELQNVIERALILCEGQTVIRPEHLLLGDSNTRHSF
jgi:DNA-binding NtrC family response regulator